MTRSRLCSHRMQSWLGYSCFSSSHPIFFLLDKQCLPFLAGLPRERSPNSHIGDPSALRRCYDLNRNSPSQAHVFEHLFPSYWHCFERPWDLWRRNLAGEGMDFLRGRPGGLQYHPASCVASVRRREVSTTRPHSCGLVTRCPCTMDCVPSDTLNNSTFTCFLSHMLVTAIIKATYIDDMAGRSIRAEIPNQFCYFTVLKKHSIYS